MFNYLVVFNFYFAQNKRTVKFQCTKQAGTQRLKSTNSWPFSAMMIISQHCIYIYLEISRSVTCHQRTLQQVYNSLSRHYAEGNNECLTTVHSQRSQFKAFAGCWKLRTTQSGIFTKQRASGERRQKPSNDESQRVKRANIAVSATWSEKYAIRAAGPRCPELQSASDVSKDVHYRSTRTKTVSATEVSLLSVLVRACVECLVVILYYRSLLMMVSQRRCV